EPGRVDPMRTKSAEDERAEQARLRRDRVDTTRLGPLRERTHCVGIESMYRALVLGLRDYVHKCGFKSVVLGLSGGIDSALTAAIAAAALGAENVRGVSLPSQYSS